jgi:hypothetical protein
LFLPAIALKLHTFVFNSRQLPPISIFVYLIDFFPNFKQSIRRF